MKAQWKAALWGIFIGLLWGVASIFFVSLQFLHFAVRPILLPVFSWVFGPDYVGIPLLLGPPIVFVFLFVSIGYILDLKNPHKNRLGCMATAILITIISSVIYYSGRRLPMRGSMKVLIPSLIITYLVVYIMSYKENGNARPNKAL